MKTSKCGFRLPVQLICFLLITCLMTTLVSACSTPIDAELIDPASTGETPAVPTSTTYPTLPPFDETTVVFAEERHTRNDTCSRTFDMHQTNYGALTISIADNLVEPRDFGELAGQVVERYTALSNTFPDFMNRPVSVFILSNPAVGDCYSKDTFVFVDPNELDSKSFIEDMLGAGSGSSEYWVRSGLASLVLGEEPDQAVLQTWYETTDDLDIAGLFYARFLDDWATEEEREIARMSAASLVQYSLEVEAIQPGQLVEKVNNDVRTRWLASLGVERVVTYPYDGQFTGFSFSHRSECSIYVQTDTIYFCLNRLPEIEYFDEVSEAEFILSHTYYGHQALVDYIHAEAPSVSHLMDLEEIISFRIIDQGAACGTADGNDVSVNNSSIYFLPLPRIVSTFNWIPLLSGSIWIEDGFIEYLGKYIPIYEQTEKRAIFEDLKGRLFIERFDGTETAQDKANPTGMSYWYFLDPEQLAAAKTWYLAQGGQMDTENAIDPLLFADAVAFATMDRNAYGGLRGITFSDKYSALHKYSEEQNLDGMELSYTQAASFLGYLSDRYTLDRVLDVYVNKAEEGLLDGKTYQELKSEWQAYLLSKGVGITIPGKP